MMDKIDHGMVFVLNNDHLPDEGELLHLELAVISQLDGQNTVGQIAENLALNSSEIEDIFQNLLSKKLLRLISRSAEEVKVPVDFYRMLTHEMTLLLGPVAGIILEDVMEMIRNHRDTIEKKNIPMLIDLLTNQIDDLVKQVEFQRNIYPKIKPYVGL